VHFKDLTPPGRTESHLKDTKASILDHSWTTPNAKSAHLGCAVTMSNQWMIGFCESRNHCTKTRSKRSPFSDAFFEKTMIGSLLFA